MITLRDISYNFFYVLFKRKLLFIIASLVVAFSVLLYAYLTTPVHRINSLVLVHQNPKQQLILFRDINTPAQTSQRVHPVYNLKEVVTSRNLSELLVAKYQLDVKWQFECEKSNRSNLNEHTHCIKQIHQREHQKSTVAAQHNMCSK